MYYLQSRYYDPEVGRFLNADALVTTGQGLLGNNMFAYCLNNPVSSTDASGTWTWIGAALGAVTGAVGSIIAGDSLCEVLLNTATGFFGGGCQSVIGSLIWSIADAVLTIVTSDSSDPIYLSLLLSVFASQINSDNLNTLLGGSLDKLTRDMFDWIFGTGADLTASGLDALISEFYANEPERGIDNISDAPDIAPPPTPAVSGPSGGSNSNRDSQNSRVPRYCFF